MLYRRLGNSDLNISEISLGSWLTYSGGVEKERSISCVRRTLDLGINFCDTANAYGRGTAETVLGEALSAVDRSSYVLATKLFFPMTPTDRGLSARQIYKQLDASLKRLRTDYVDLYQCHRYDPETPLEETMRALTDVVAQEKYPGTSVSVNGPLPKYKRHSNWPGSKDSFPASRSILCCGVSPKLKSFRCAARMVSHKLYGHRWHKAYSRGNTVRAPNRRTTRAPPTKGWAACSIARGSRNRCWKQY